MRGFTARPSDYDKDLTLELMQDEQGDIYVAVCVSGLPVENRDRVTAELRFTRSAGGGHSHHTNLALCKLLEAMKKDEQESPWRAAPKS